MVGMIIADDKQTDNLVSLMM